MQERKEGEGVGGVRDQSLFLTRGERRNFFMEGDQENKRWGYSQMTALIGGITKKLEILSRDLNVKY